MALTTKNIYGSRTLFGSTHFVDSINHFRCVYLKSQTNRHYEYVPIDNETTIVPFEAKIDNHTAIELPVARAASPRESEEGPPEVTLYAS